MSSYEDLLKLAQENTRVGHENLAELKRKQEKEKRRLDREQQKERAIHEKQRQHIESVAQKRVEPISLPKRPTSIPSRPVPKLKPLSTSTKPTVSKQTSSTKESKLNKQTTSSSFQANHPFPESSRHLQDRKPQPVAEKKAAFLSFEELKKIAEDKAAAPKPKPSPYDRPSLPSKKVGATVQKTSSYTSGSKPQRVPSLVKQAVPSSPSHLRQRNGQIDKAQVSSNKPKLMQNAPRPQFSTPFPPKRPLPTENRVNQSGLTGSRFAKYGPIDSEPPLKSIKSSASSRPNRPSAIHNPSKSSLASESQIPRNKVGSNERISKPNRPSHSVPERVRSSQVSASKATRPVDREFKSHRAISPTLPRKRALESHRNRFDPRDEIIDEDFAKNNISSIIGSLFGYDRSKYQDDFSDDDMEVSASRVRAEELRSARIGREEDEREEALERQRLQRLRQKKNNR